MLVYFLYFIYNKKAVTESVTAFWAYLLFVKLCNLLHKGIDIHSMYHSSLFKRLSPVQEGIPDNCMPAFIRTGAISGFVLNISPIVISLVIVAMRLSSYTFKFLRTQKLHSHITIILYGNKSKYIIIFNKNFIIYNRLYLIRYFTHFLYSGACNLPLYILK